MNRSEERKRAQQLKAVDVRDVLRASLPAVLPLISDHIDQLQRMLDVEAINADIDTRIEDLTGFKFVRGKGTYSEKYLRDPSQRDKLLAQKLRTRRDENVVSVDYRKLVTADALRPRSDNADEAAYLLVVAEAFEHHGIWLLLDSSAAFMYRQMAVTDPRKWRVRLILGYKTGLAGGEITTRDGRLTREAMLSVSRLSAGYYDWVHKGPTMRSLDGALSSLDYQLDKGWNEHTWWFSHRAEFPIVSKVSDFFGGADWPDTDIWRQPRDIRLRALELINEGKTTEAAKFALLAAFQTEWCARAVREYANATTKGASRVVSILEVIAVCGEIAGWILSILAVGHGVARLLGQKGGQAALQGGGQRMLPPPAEVPKTPTGTLRGSGVGPANAPAGAPSPGLGPVPHNPGTLISDYGKDLGNAIAYARQKLGMPPLMARTLNGGRTNFALAENARFRKAHAEFMDWLLRNPKATLAQKEARRERVLDHWVWDH